VSGERADKNRDAAAQTGSQHAAATVAIRVGAIGEGDVKRARTHDEAAPGVADCCADGQRERYTQRIAERHRGRDFTPVEALDRLP
jgi:hypothetical protein